MIFVEVASHRAHRRRASDASAARAPRRVPRPRPGGLVLDEYGRASVSRNWRPRAARIPHAAPAHKYTLASPGVCELESSIT